MKLADMISINKQILTEGNKRLVNADELMIDNPVAYEKLPDVDGTIYAYDEYFFFRPKKAKFGLFWGAPATKYRYDGGLSEPPGEPYFNASGEWVGSEPWSWGDPAGWFFLSDFSRDQSRYIEKGFNPLPPYERTRPKKIKTQSAKEEPGYLPSQIASPHMGTATARSRGFVRDADYTSKIKEPNWDNISIEDLEIALRKSILKSKTDGSYKNVTKRIAAALAKKGGKISGGSIPDVDKSSKLERRKKYAKFLIKNKKKARDSATLLSLAAEIQKEFGVKKSVVELRHDYDLIASKIGPKLESVSRLADCILENTFNVWGTVEKTV